MKTNLIDVGSGNHYPDAILLDCDIGTSRMLTNPNEVFIGTNLLKNRLSYKVTHKRLMKAGNNGMMVAQLDMEIHPVGWTSNGVNEFS